MQEVGCRVREEAPTIKRMDMMRKMFAGKEAPTIKRISLADDYSPFPGGRYPNDGEFNATRFREDILVPALKSADIVEVSLDGVGAVAASFLEEAFGRWITENGVDSDYARDHLRIVTTEKMLDVHQRLAERYLSAA